MAAGKCEISRCGLCRFYRHEGRRGGACNQLDVTVNAHWKACSLAVSPFVSTPKKTVGIKPEIHHWVADISKEEPVLPALSASTPAALSVTTP